MKLPARIFATIGFAFIALGLPLLEVSATHVFNPSWPPHARFHEVWQLITNGGIALVGLWLIWVRGEIRLASILGVLIMGGAVAASVLGSLYGGAVTYEGGPSIQILGFHAANVIPAILVALFLLAFFLESRDAKPPG